MPEKFSAHQKPVQLTNEIKSFDAAAVAEARRILAAEKFGDIFWESAQMTIRDFFHDFIDMIQEYNISCGGPTLAAEKVKAIKEGHLRGNINGFVFSCKNPDALILEYLIESDIEVPKFNESTKAWEKAPSRNIFFKTTAGSYVYVSAINTIKTRDSFDRYMGHLRQAERCA